MYVAVCVHGMECDRRDACHHAGYNPLDYVYCLFYYTSVHSAFNCTSSWYQNASQLFYSSWQPTLWIVPPYDHLQLFFLTFMSLIALLAAGWSPYNFVALQRQVNIQTWYKYERATVYEVVHRWKDTGCRHCLWKSSPLQSHGTATRMTLMLFIGHISVNNTHPQFETSSSPAHKYSIFSVTL